MDLRLDVFDVKLSTLQRLMHATVFAPIRGSQFDLLSDCRWHTHCGVRPSSRHASAFTSERHSLISTNCWSSARSSAVSCPSLFRSINSRNREFDRGLKPS
jgi:hypothetical protein